MTSVQRLAVCLGCCLAGLATSPVIALGEDSLSREPGPSELGGSSERSKSAGLSASPEVARSPEDAGSSGSEAGGPFGLGSGGLGASPVGGELSGGGDGSATSSGI